MNELLKQLTEAVGVSGAEKEVRILIRDLVQDHVDSWHVDPLGNLIAFKKGTGESDLRVMVDAHMDEVGLIITDVDSNGTYKFSPVGGFDDRALLGKMVQVGEKKITGVIGARPIHLTSAAERGKVAHRSGMRIDIGATSKDNAKGQAGPGDRAAFLTTYEELGHVAIGKAFDDRAGCALVIELLKGEPYPFDLYASFTVQEEIGLRGATTAAYHIKPDVAIVIDCTPALDIPAPGDPDESTNVALGAGPAVYVMDRGTIQDPRLVQYLLKTAADHEIPVQVRRPGGGGTNTASIQRNGGSVAAATVSLPGRYLHAPTSMIDLSDYGHTLQLVEAALRNLNADTIRRS